MAKKEISKKGKRVIDDDDELDGVDSSSSEEEDNFVGEDDPDNESFTAEKNKRK
jgi:hypothetical protein